MQVLEVQRVMYQQEMWEAQDERDRQNAEARAGLVGEREQAMLAAYVERFKPSMNQVPSERSTPVRPWRAFAERLLWLQKHGERADTRSAWDGGLSASLDDDQIF